MPQVASTADRHEHPLDVIERLASTRSWQFDRDADDEIAITVTGRWAEYHVAFTWLPDMEALHVACAFDLKVADTRRAETLALVSAINEKLWIGHFDVWSNDNVVMFRHALLLAGGAQPNSTQCEAILDIALDACDRHFQAFQFVVWAGRPAQEALEAVMFETVGEA
ncbi:MAG: YbjN domain-containing protein [Beijerinckiaceae bacterium]